MPEPSATQEPLNPEILQKSLAEIAEKSARVVTAFAHHQPHADMARNLEELGINKAFAELSRQLLSDPMKLAELQMRMWEDYVKLWNSSLSRFLGAPASAVKEPARNDARFKSEVWQNNFVFDYIKQSYLIAAEHVLGAVSNVQGLSPEALRKVKFFTRQYVNAIAPTNFVFTNPEVLKTTIESGGKNLLEGLKRLLHDLERGHGKLQISMTDPKAFTMGVNVASTPGKVVFQNELMQLLQFNPTTKDVSKAPLLIVPPWINKYYILDLREKNSFIKWAADQGHTVFVISWVNPDSRHTDKTFADYLLEGPVAAMDAIEKATGESSVNMIGYCLGGTLTTCLLAWLEAKGQARRIKSMTFFTTMIDFTEPGELGVFVDENVVKHLEKRMSARGYLEGQEMAGTFNMLRDNDLIWSFVVNNYLMGKDPFPFDLLYWNSDATRMPAKMHTFYLRNMYIKNLLREHGTLELAGEKLDLAKVRTPVYFISTMEDHIAPWKSTYAGAKLFKSDVRFVLGGSGHIAGIVNPPAAQKYCYWTNSTLSANPEEWLSNAERTDGSWWNDWQKWVSKFSGGKTKARVPGDGKVKVIEDAPGAYAKFRLDVQPVSPKTENDAPANRAQEAEPNSATTSTGRLAAVEAKTKVKARHIGDLTTNKVTESKQSEAGQAKKAKLGKDQQIRKKTSPLMAVKSRKASSSVAPEKEIASLKKSKTHARAQRVSDNAANEGTRQRTRAPLTPSTSDGSKSQSVKRPVDAAAISALFKSQGTGTSAAAPISKKTGSKS